VNREERRKFPRYVIELAAEVYLKEDILFAATKDLSEGGICLDIERELTPGSILGLSLLLTLEGIQIAEEEPLDLKAKIVWCQRKDEEIFTVGAQFIDITSLQKKRLKKFLEILAKSKSPE
jgi:hypothetical protein